MGGFHYVRNVLVSLRRAILMNFGQEWHLALLAGGSYPRPKAASIKTFDDFAWLQFLAIGFEVGGTACCNFLHKPQSSAKASAAACARLWRRSTPRARLRHCCPYCSSPAPPVSRKSGRGEPAEVQVWSQQPPLDYRFALWLYKTSPVGTWIQGFKRRASDRWIISHTASMSSDC